ncbi:MAG: helix-turn-helix transcriptional regulator [Clostridia bacterium]|nr:helix-turn-helix transcriptional regulator [Clostridia bacterium]
MAESIFTLSELSVRPAKLALHVPPEVWKGDRLGHIGVNDTFFFVVTGECFLSIDGQSRVVRTGQLAFLPKGKRRAYTRVSETFAMYEIGFSAEVNGNDLMEALGLCEGEFVTDVADIERMKGYFESSSRVEMQKNPLYDIIFCANIMNIIKEYAIKRLARTPTEDDRLQTVLSYMRENLSRPISNEELAAAVFMQTTYFIRRFKNAYGLPPQSYLTQMRMNRAMELLASTSLSIDSVAKAVGMADVSYFARVFKKHSGVTPSAYRSAFSR